jgi:hypothetical protein
MHEYGHLAGYTDPLNPSDPSHSHDPDDIMFPFEHPDARCDDYGSAFLGVPRPPEAPAPAPTSRVAQPVLDAEAAAATRRKAARIRRRVRLEQRHARRKARARQVRRRTTKAARRSSAVVARQGAVRSLKLTA